MRATWPGWQPAANPADLGAAAGLTAPWPGGSRAHRRAAVVGDEGVGTEPPAGEVTAPATVVGLPTSPTTTSATEIETGGEPVGAAVGVVPVTRKVRLWVGPSPSATTPSARISWFPTDASAGTSKTSVVSLSQPLTPATGAPSKVTTQPAPKSERVTVTCVPAGPLCGLTDIEYAKATPCPSHGPTTKARITNNQR